MTTATYYDGSYFPGMGAAAPPIVPAVDAAAGTPGEWLPAGAQVPTLVQANTITPTAAAAWATGQWIATASAAPNDKIHWTGATWVPGTAAVAEEIVPQQRVGDDQPQTRRRKDK